ncbi:MAG: tyrosine-type recombinase/integrase [Bulleidia sp.]
MEKIITEACVNAFCAYLRSEERSRHTLEKYSRDLKAFMAFQDGRPVTKESVISYKDYLLSEKYSNTSINSMLAAVNSFLTFMNWHECRVRSIRIQRKAFMSKQMELTREEYLRLVKTARKQGNFRLGLVIETICATGIRVSELAYITVEAIRQGCAVVSCKGKVREIFLVRDLQEKLKKYARRKHIEEGPVFVTRSGKPLERSNIWRQMKKLCEEAGVEKEKVFPHNLRHLFARTFYRMEKDIAKLADVLGHSSINTTRIYITTTSEEHNRIMEHMKLIL